jgi:hypothetical protein
MRAERGEEGPKPKHPEHEQDLSQDEAWFLRRCHPTWCCRRRSRCRAGGGSAGRHFRQVSSADTPRRRIVVVAAAMGALLRHAFLSEGELPSYRRFRCFGKRCRKPKSAGGFAMRGSVQRRRRHKSARLLLSGCGSAWSGRPARPPGIGHRAALASPMAGLSTRFDSVGPLFLPGGTVGG